MKRRVRPNSSRKPRPAPPGVEAVLDIVGIGARGDAIAQTENGPVYVPFALPGERVRARVAGDRATDVAVQTASPERIAPACAHFGVCGGCQLQHWAEQPYLAWKQDQVRLALARRGLDVEVAPAIPAWSAGRRRAALHADRAGGALRFGFLERAGAEIADIAACPVLTPALAEALPRLRALAEAFAPARGRITLHCLASETGIDVAIAGAGRPEDFDLKRLEAAAQAAEALDVARLSFDGEPFVTRRTPVVTIGRAQVTPPPGAFLQATLDGERALARLALDAVQGAGRVADLFSGVGTFALRLCETAQVHAVESEAAMLAALQRAADGAGLGARVTTQARDLMRDPLMAAELEGFDAIVFDPPRAGARAQAEQIGASGVRRVAAVSCDPPTFARDVRILVDAGFRLTRVTPVDQFRWTPHVEVVGALER
jgi:23S rRNA (uracil1939-C5)-methyltransferase